MLVKNFDKKAYSILLNHIFKNSSYFSLTKYIYNNDRLKRKIIDFIEHDYDYRNILKTDYLYIKLFEDIIKKYENNIQIYKMCVEEQIERFKVLLKSAKNIQDDFCEKYIHKQEEILKKISKEDILNCNNKEILLDTFSWEIYYNNADKIIDKYSNKILKKIKEINNFGGSDTKNKIHSIIYYFKLDEEMKEYILSNSNIFDWCFPNYMEDLTFYNKKNDIIFYSVSHEEICDIYCENEEEYNYLKSMGVNFYEDHYVKEEYIDDNNYRYECEENS